MITVDECASCAAGEPAAVVAAATPVVPASPYPVDMDPGLGEALLTSQQFGEIYRAALVRLDPADPARVAMCKIASALLPATNYRVARRWELAAAAVDHCRADTVVASAFAQPKPVPVPAMVASGSGRRVRPEERAPDPWIATFAQEVVNASASGPLATVRAARQLLDRAQSAETAFVASAMDRLEVQVYGPVETSRRREDRRVRAEFDRLAGRRRRAVTAAAVEPIGRASMVVLDEAGRPVGGPAPFWVDPELDGESVAHVIEQLINARRVGDLATAAARGRQLLTMLDTAAGDLDRVG